MIILHTTDGFAHVIPAHAIEKFSVRKSESGEYVYVRIVAAGSVIRCEIVPYTGELLTRDIFGAADEVVDLWERAAQ